jgi:hypothetical protein
MTKIHTQNAPDISVVKPHFLFGSLAFAVAVVLMILADGELLMPYYHTKILAIVHTGLLGWSMMIIYGSLYQLVPVVFETKLYSEPLAKVTFWITGLAVALMAYSFWTGQLNTWLVWSAYLIYTGLFFFVFNIGMSYKNATIKNIKNYFIIAAIFWLFVAQTEGLLMALNFKYNILEAGNLYHLKIHALAGLVGFFLQMIFGVGTTLIPMFLVSHKHSEKPLWPSFIFLNAGLSLLFLSWLYFPGRLFTATGWILITLSLFFYIRFAYEAYKLRFKRILDEGMQPTMLIFITLFIPWIISGLLVAYGDKTSGTVLMLGSLLIFSMIFGVINLIILGQTYKTIPFIIWLERYQPYVGKYKIPLPREVYHASLALWQYKLYLVFFLLFTTGLIFHNKTLTGAATLVLAIVALMYNFNMVKMFFHRPRLEPLENEKKPAPARQT